MTTMEALVQGYYGRSDLLQRIEARLRNAGVDPQKPGFRDLHPFDQLRFPSLRARLDAPINPYN